MGAPLPPNRHGTAAPPLSPHAPAVRSAEREHGPKGTVQAFDARSGGVAAESSVYPGTLHRWWLYVPAGYDELDSTADCNLIVFTDGLKPDAVHILDNLIADKLIPPTIGVFVSPGVRPDGQLPDGVGPDPFAVREGANLQADPPSLGDPEGKVIHQVSSPPLAVNGSRYAPEPWLG